MMNLNGCSLVSIDVETTGLTPGYHEIYQIGAIALNSNLEPLEGSVPLDLWIRPENFSNIDYAALEMTQEQFFSKISLGISSERGLELWEYWVKSQVKLAEGKKIMFVGQNIAQHDIPFLKSWWGNHYHQQYIHHHVRDTMLTAICLNDMADYLREPFPFPRMDLRNLMSYLGFENIERNQHDAVYDAYCAAKIYRAQVRMYLSDMKRGLDDSNRQ